MKFRTWSDSVDPDTSCWRESGEDKVYFLMVLRIFLEVGVGQVNRIGIYNKSKSPAFTVTNVDGYRPCTTINVISCTIKHTILSGETSYFRANNVYKISVLTKVAHL